MASPDLITQFVNTALLESGEDTILTPSGLNEWLVAHDLADPDDQFGLDDVASATELREALRDLIGSKDRVWISAEVGEVLNRIGGGAPLRVAFASSGEVRLSPAFGLPLQRAFAAIMAAVYQSVVDGSWQRLKLCQNPRCRWVFYDRSRNRSGRWCTMAICGNRAKTSRFRMRRRLRKQQV